MWNKIEACPGGNLQVCPGGGGGGGGGGGRYNRSLSRGGFVYCPEGGGGTFAIIVNIVIGPVYCTFGVIYQDSPPRLRGLRTTPRGEGTRSVDVTSFTLRDGGFDSHKCLKVNGN